MNKLLVLCIIVLFTGCTVITTSNKKRVSVVSGGIIDRVWETYNVESNGQGYIIFYDCSNGKRVWLSANYVLEDL